MKVTKQSALYHTGAIKERILRLPILQGKGLRSKTPVINVEKADRDILNKGKGNPKSDKSPEDPEQQPILHFRVENNMVTVCEDLRIYHDLLLLLYSQIYIYLYIYVNICNVFNIDV
jgi:hypothetical protein